MTKLLILGTSNAIPAINRENTHMALVGEHRLILIDCGNNPIIHLQHAGIDIQSVTDLILTHFHPDHVAGVPSFLMNSWLMGRKSPLTIYGLAYTLDRLENLMIAYDWESWPNFFPVQFVRLPVDEFAPVLEDDEIKIVSSEVCHMIPTIGLRVEFPKTGKVLAYSCDTEPCPEVERLSNGADLLIHESSGEGIGHSSAGQAGDIAAKSNSQELMLIHFNAEGDALETLLSEARAHFKGKVFAAQDFQTVNF
jgi:ribonuclease Z